MKISYKKYIGTTLLTLGLGGAILSGCTSDFDKMNENPLSVQLKDPRYLASYIIEKGSRVQPWEYQIGDNLYGQMFAQYFSNRHIGFPTDMYGYKDNWAKEAFWDVYYSQVLKNFDAVKSMMEQDKSYSDIYNMVKIFVAYTTAQNTDIFGDMPYFEAGKGIAQPKYDSQKDIYKDIFKQLSEAVKSLEENIPDQKDFNGNLDMIYFGNKSQWIKFGNSLRLRYAMRISLIEPNWAKQEGEAALSDKGGLISNNSDNASLKVSGDGMNGNPLMQDAAWDDYCMSSTMERILLNESSVADPRLPLWFGFTQATNKGKGLGEYKGQPNGVNATQRNADNDISLLWGLINAPEWNQKGVKPQIWKITTPLVMMNYAEVCLLKAEAALRGWNNAGTAKDNYLAGIQASFDEARGYLQKGIEVDKSKDETYKTTGKVSWNDGADFETHLKQIITQKWLAMYPNGIEAWSEFRRTGYPALSNVMNSLDPTINVEKGEFVKKIRYNDAERRDNPNSLSPSLNGGKGDGMNVRVWWDTARYK